MRGPVLTGSAKSYSPFHDVYSRESSWRIAIGATGTGYTAKTIVTSGVT
jgi:hypothetical protein